MKFLICLVLLSSVLARTAQGQGAAARMAARAVYNADDCPPPTKVQMGGLCADLKDKTPGDNKLIKGPKYHESLWMLACASDKDTSEQGNAKVKKYLDKYLSVCGCYGFTGISINDSGSVLKFAMDVGFSTFVRTLLQRYDINPNFIDPVDGETLLDFILRRIEELKESGYHDAQLDFEMTRDILYARGAKRASELK